MDLCASERPPGVEGGESDRLLVETSLADRKRYSAQSIDDLEQRQESQEGNGPPHKYAHESNDLAPFQRKRLLPQLCWQARVRSAT